MGKNKTFVPIDEIVDCYVKKFYPSDDHQDEETINALKSMIISNIEEQIIEKNRSKMLLELDKEAKRKAKLYKIKEFRSVLISGIIIAFLMGLAVNQITDFITYIKTKSIDNSPVGITLAIAGICIIICLIVFFYHFVVEGLKIIGKEEHSNDDKDN